MSREMNKEEACPKIKDYNNLPKPVAINVERAFISALMIDRDAHKKIGFVLPEMFYNDHNRIIYEAELALIEEDKPIDCWTVAHKLASQNKLEEVGGAAYVAEISSKVKSSANIEYHGRIIAQYYVIREAIDNLLRTASNATELNKDVSDILEECQETLDYLSRINVDDGVQEINDVLKKVYHDIMEASARKNDIVGLTSGYPLLDKITMGWQSKDLILIGGRPGTGKTTFALCLAKHLIVNSIPVGIFSLEMKSDELVRRIVANECEIELRKIKNGQMSDKEWERLDVKINNLIDAPLYIVDDGNITLAEIKRKAKHLVRDNGVKLIIIDFVQRINVPSCMLSYRQTAVEYSAYALKELAKILDVPIIALTQLNREVEKREGWSGKRPMTSDMEGSGKLDQAANIVILLYRPEMYGIYQDDTGKDLHGKVELTIPKNRDGEGGDKTVRLDFAGRYAKFENSEDKNLTPYPLDDQGVE